LDLDPGGSATERIAVSNLSADRDAQFLLQAADGYFTQAGRFNMLADPSASVDAGTWIDAPATVEVPAGETVVVPFTIRVPADAEPGDHAAGIAAALVSSNAGADAQPGVGVVSRFGIRVMTRVTGELVPGLKVDAVNGSYDLSWNPFRAGELALAFDLTNTGNARLYVTGRVEAGGGSAYWPAPDAPRVELLPGESRRVEVAVDGVWPWFSVGAAVQAVPEVLSLEGVEPPELGPVGAKARFWAMPWPQLAVLAGAGLIVWSALAGRARSRRRLAALLERARADERAKAAQAQAGAEPGPENASKAEPDPESASRAEPGPESASRTGKPVGETAAAGNGGASAASGAEKAVERPPVQGGPKAGGPGRVGWAPAPRGDDRR
jgi:hypothetical protein